MTAGFVWFSLGASDPEAARAFYASLLGWEIGEQGMVAGGDGPFAAIAEADGAAGWIPYVQVEDVDAATRRARELGANVVHEKTRGPAGEYATIADPAGGTVALWAPAG